MFFFLFYIFRFLIWPVVWPVDLVGVVAAIAPGADNLPDEYPEDQGTERKKDD